jgi:hypothetical protein
LEEEILEILQSEVEFQCKCVLIAAGLLSEQFAPGTADEDFDAEIVWFALQSVLIASANLSKLFWGSRGKKEAERLDLRLSLSVADDSPLRDPDLRNDFEHFDTRVEDWFRDSESHNFAGRNIGRLSAITGIDVKDRFQWFDDSTGIVTFWTHSVALPLVLAEVQRIHPLARDAVRGPAPPPISQMRCGTCGNLTPQCTCLDSQGQPIRWE